MRTQITYTDTERKEKRYTQSDITTAARARLREVMRRRRKVSDEEVISLCVNALPRQSGARYTLEELNELADQVVSDTLYYDGHLY